MNDLTKYIAENLILMFSDLVFNLEKFMENKYELNRLIEQEESKSSGILYDSVGLYNGRLRI